MPDVNSLLDDLRSLTAQPPAAPSPMPEVSRRAGRIVRRRRLVMALSSVLLVVVGAVGVVVLTDDETDVDVTTDPQPAASEPATSAAATSPADYVDQVIDLIEANAYYASPELAASWREQAPAIAAGASTTADTYEFVLSMANQVSEPHAGNTLWVPERAAAWTAAVPSPLDELPSAEVDGDIGYIALSAIDGAPASDDGGEYVDHVREAVGGPACGWILDLRATFHPSNAETMLSAISPLLPVGPVLRYRHGDGTETALVSGPDGAVEATADNVAASATGASPGVPAAVLQGPETSGAYEAVLLALQGRDNVRTFGEPSGGGTNEVMESFPLSDGSLLWLTTRLPLDQAGNVVEGAIPPDVATPERQAGEDTARAAAADWLAQQGTCG